MSKAQSCTRTNKDTVDVMGSSTETKHIAQGGGESLDGRHRAGGPAVVQQQVGSSGHAVRDGQKRTALNERGWLAGRGQGARRAARHPWDLGTWELRVCRGHSNHWCSWGLLELPLWPASPWVDSSVPRAACDPQGVEGAARCRGSGVSVGKDTEGNAGVQGRQEAPSLQPTLC